MTRAIDLEAAGVVFVHGTTTFHSKDATLTAKVFEERTRRGRLMLESMRADGTPRIVKIAEREAARWGECVTCCEPIAVYRGGMCPLCCSALRWALKERGKKE